MTKNRAVFLYIVISAVIILMLPTIAMLITSYVNSIFSNKYDLDLLLIIPVYMIFSILILFLLLFLFKNRLSAFANKKEILIYNFIIYFFSFMGYTIYLYYGLEKDIFSIGAFIITQQMVILPGMLVLAPFLFVVQDKSFANKYFFTLCVLAIWPAGIILWPLLIVYYPLLVLLVDKLKSGIKS